MEWEINYDCEKKCIGNELNAKSEYSSVEDLSKNVEFVMISLAASPGNIITFYRHIFDAAHSLV